MAEWVPCYHCKYWFEPDNDKKNYKVVEFKGTIIGVLCPHCSGYMEKEQKEKIA